MPMSDLAYYIFYHTYTMDPLVVSFMCSYGLYGQPTSPLLSSYTPLYSPPFLSSPFMTRHRIYDCQNLAILSLSTPLYIPSGPSIMVQFYFHKVGDAPGTKNTSAINGQFGTRMLSSASRFYFHHHFQISVSTL